MAATMVLHPRNELGIGILIKRPTGNKHLASCMRCGHTCPASSGCSLGCAGPFQMELDEEREEMILDCGQGNLITVSVLPQLVNIVKRI